MQQEKHTCYKCNKTIYGNDNVELDEKGTRHLDSEQEKCVNIKNILIPFVGFYESLASNRVEEMAFRNYVIEKGIPDNEKTGWLDTPEDMTEAEQTDFWDNYYPEHVEELQKEVAVAYMDALGSEIGLDLKFESISSPRYYNYTTDRLFVDADLNELIHLYNRTDQTILAEMIKERHTSGPGFNSYYENDINDPSWQDPALYDHNQWCTVIEAYVKQNEVELSDLYWI